MNNVMDFNRIKNLILKLAKDHGIPEEKLIDSWNKETEDLDWSINYKRDIHQTFLEDIKDMQYGLDLYEVAMAQKDLLAAKAGLQSASVFAHNLSSFFWALKEDLEHAYTGKEFNWPKFPEDYTIPEHYNYKGPK